MVDRVKTFMKDAQKEISRALVPDVRSGLKQGYVTAIAEVGPGSVTRQKAVFHTYIDHTRHNVFQGGTKHLFTLLDKAAQDIGNLLLDSLSDLAERTETHIAVLWEGTKDTLLQQERRAATLTLVEQLHCQMNLWAEARQRSGVSAPQSLQGSVEEDELVSDE